MGSACCGAAEPAAACADAAAASGPARAVLRLGRLQRRGCGLQRRDDRDVREPPLFDLEQPAHGLELGLQVLESAFVLGAELLDQLLELRLGGVDLLL